jgi:DNA replication protein DnaC
VRHCQAATVPDCFYQWYASIGDNTLADAILDRLMRNAHRLQLKGESMRKILGQLTDNEHLS